MSAFGFDYRRMLRSPKKYQRRACAFWIKQEIRKTEILRLQVCVALSCWVLRIKSQRIVTKGRKGMCMGSRAGGERSLENKGKGVADLKQLGVVTQKQRGFWSKRLVLMRI